MGEAAAMFISAWLIRMFADEKKAFASQLAAKPDCVCQEQTEALNNKTENPINISFLVNTQGTFNRPMLMASVEGKIQDLSISDHHDCQECKGSQKQ